MLSDKFFDEVSDTLFFGSLPTFQKQPLADMGEEFSRRGWKDLNKLAYIMATTYHETERYKTLVEYGRGRGRDYGVKLLTIRGKSEAYYGRGWVQLTWLRNYAKLSIAASMALGKTIDLVNDPDILTRDTEVNAFVAFEGMAQGLFTGRKLNQYFNATNCNFTGARKIINGTDKATLIAGYASKFREALANGWNEEEESTEEERRPFKFHQ